LSKVLTDESNYAAIASAIRAKGGASRTLRPEEMAAAIRNISGGGGGAAVIESKTITENGTYTAPSGVDGYSPIMVDVPNSYAAEDEGKVVSNGALVAQGSDTVTDNGTVDTTLISSLVVNVSGGGGGGLPLGIAVGGFEMANLGMSWSNSAEESVT
jgi:hypothetical protein